MPNDATISLTLSIYNPGTLKKEDLVRGFVARQDLLHRLLEDLRREGRDDRPQHQLLIGQRGLGKTTLLRRLAYAVEDDAELSKIWMPLSFPEEQYNVGSLGDFWLNCLDALSDALDRRGDSKASEALDARIKAVPRTGDKRAMEALRILMDEANRLSRRFLLLVDNIDIVLDRLPREQEWEFRRVLSEERSLHIVGASSRFLEAVYEHGRAFYDFFQVHELRGLEDEELFKLLRHLAKESGRPDVEGFVEKRKARIKALRVLTGGNPRTALLLFRILAEGPEGDVQRDVEQLLDLYTPLYKSRFEDLAAQAQQVVDAVAIHWDPLTAAELAKSLGLPVSQVSAQLKRLEDFGVVEKTPWFGGKKAAFQIAERFFNIWYLMRASRRLRRKLIWLAKFLEAWFDQEELGERAAGFLKCDQESMGRERFAEMALAYAQAIAERWLRDELESAGLRAIVRSRTGINLDSKQPSPDEQQRAEAALLELTKEPDFEIQAWSELGLLRNRLRRYEEVAEAFRHAIGLDPQFPDAWFGLLWVLHIADRDQEASDALVSALQTLREPAYVSLISAGFIAAWSQSEADLPFAVTVAKKAIEVCPDDPGVESAFVNALTLAGEWDKAKGVFERLTTGDYNSFASNALRTIAKTNHTAEAIEIMERAGADERWRPTYEALKAAQAGTPDYLRRIAPEVRSVAEDILKEIAPELN